MSQLTNFPGCNNSTFNTVHFGKNPFTCSKSLNGFKSAISIGRFSSDGAASTAVKGLRKILGDVNTEMLRVLPRRDFERVKFGMPHTQYDGSDSTVSGMTGESVHKHQNCGKQTACISVMSSDTSWHPKRGCHNKWTTTLTSFSLR